MTGQIEMWLWKLCFREATHQQDPGASLSTNVTFDQRSHAIPAASAANPPHEQVGGGFARSRQSVEDAEAEVPERHLVAHVPRHFQDRDSRGNRVVEKTTLGFRCFQFEPHVCPI